jgi:hypothetical protein
MSLIVTLCVFRVAHVDRMRICRNEMVLLSTCFMRVACARCWFAQPTHAHVVGFAKRVFVYNITNASHMHAAIRNTCTHMCCSYDTICARHCSNVANCAHQCRNVGSSHNQHGNIIVSSDQQCLIALTPISSHRT